MKKSFLVNFALLIFLCSGARAFSQGAFYKVLNYEQLEKACVTIETKWDFYWGKFVEPEDQVTAPDLQVTVPCEWNKYDLPPEAKAIAKKGYGSGTYRLTLTGLKEDTEYSFPVFEVFYTACKIYADSKLIYQCGQPAEKWKSSNGRRRDQ